ncbi:type III-B CRISPR module RAMP protein Cmr1 [Streptomyces chiangmaiensis]|uniref:Type III-B CRISPR module RAMP protein Cmr1 n=1 Tax=Streptomyces chiangmaiensis TaxID=766497 RepID=A0ABU7FMY6_9ACTN|nr:type III-B CRISPR module RAMP protein Cmr1 [Streptomyces chiangmaiensis]MED7825495.1 type III-B CRISPR module RAMP protein Cmr1 [Streptomyces chiangmaiensis]
MPWTTLTLETTTPVFNGEHGQSGATVRVPSLRGGMRFWFRALAGNIVGNDLDLLAKLEHDVFGATDQQSRIALRIPNPPKSAPREMTKSEMNTGGIEYLLGQGLYDSRKKQLLRSFVRPGRTFDLEIRFAPKTSEAIISLAFTSLWLLCAYGGIGSRVRRGFGGLRISEVAKDSLPDGWGADSLITPQAPHYQRLSHLTAEHGIMKQHRKWLAALESAPSDLDSRPDPWGDTLPTYPVLGRHTAVALRPGRTDWPGLLTTAGDEWRHFRASEDTAKSVRTPEYRSVVHGTSKDFPLGALGLPISFFDGRETYVAEVRGEDGGSLRRASPVWLRPVGTGNGTQLFSFAFLGRFLPPAPDQPHVYLGDKELRVTDQDIADRAGRWLDKMRAGGTFVRNSKGR